MTTATYILRLPWKRPPLTMNHRFGRGKLMRVVRDVRQTTAWLGTAAKMKPGQSMTVQLHYAPGRRSTLDAHNLHYTTKVCVDGLARGKRRDWVGLEIVPNDSSEYVTIPEAKVHYPVEVGPQIGPCCWLVVTVQH